VPKKIKKCGQASHPTAFVRGFLPCLVTAWWRNDRFSPTALPLPLSRAKERRVPHLPKRSRRFVILRSPTRDCCGGQRSFPAPCFKEARERGGGGGRNARATSRACARFLECPPAIHPRESPVAAGSAAIIRQAQELSRFAEPTLIQIVAPRNTKNFSSCAETVDDESSLWTPVEI